MRAAGASSPGEQLLPSAPCAPAPTPAPPCRRRRCRRCRHAEEQSRPGAVEALRATCSELLGTVTGGAPAYAHLSDAEKQQVAKECTDAMDWLSEKAAMQGQLKVGKGPAAAGLPAACLHAPPHARCAPLPGAPPAVLTTSPPAPAPRAQKHDEPVLVSADVLKKRDVVERVCRPIVSRKPPPPPKAEPAPQPEATPTAEPMEAEPQAEAASEEAKPMEQ